MTKYMATTGINFVPEDAEDKEEVRVEAGDYVEGMSERSLENEIAAGNIAIVEEEVKTDGNRTRK